MGGQLDPGDDGLHDDAYLADLGTGELVRVSTAASGADGDRRSRATSISADGKTVAFYSKASNLVARDTHPGLDVYVTKVPQSATSLVQVDPHHLGDPA